MIATEVRQKIRLNSDAVAANGRGKNAVRGESRFGACSGTHWRYSRGSAPFAKRREAFAEQGQSPHHSSAAYELAFLLLRDQ